MAEIKKPEERKPQTLDEMQMHRQSAPRPEAQDEAQRIWLCTKLKIRENGPEEHTEKEWTRRCRKC